MMSTTRCIWLAFCLAAVIGANGALVDDNENVDHDKFHPDKGVQSMLGDATTAPLAMSSREVPTTNDWHNPPLAATTTSLAEHDSDDDDDNDNDKKNFLELNLTAASSTPSWDKNNTVEVSISLALPLAWNLTSKEDELAVETLVEDVSTAATLLFHDTLDHAITMLDGSPGTLVYEDIAKDADHPTAADEKPRNPHPVQNMENGTHALLLANETEDATGHDDNGIDWLLSTDGNHTDSNNTHNNSTNLSSNSTHPPKQLPKEPPSETMLWDWLGMETITKEELYKMVLEFLDIEDQQDWHNASVPSPLLRDLKAEIRQAIYGYFFELQQRQADLHRARNESLVNSSALPIHDQPLPSNTSSHHWLIPEDPNLQDFDDESDHPGFFASGLWEMFLADTRVELVMVQDTYAWWQLTMIYPVYVHYQASPDVNDDYELLDDTTTSMTAFNNNNNVSGGVPEGTTAAGPSATENGPYWEPVTDQGTLDFIGRLLQRVLEAAVHSGAFLQSLQSLQQQTHLFYDVPSRESASANIVGEILEVTIPGMEHELDELISPYDDMEDEEPLEFDMGLATDPPLELPWGSGTYTYSILDAGGVDRRQQGGMLLLLVTFCATSGIVLMAVWRNVLHQRDIEQGWLLGTEQDVPELLQVGWKQYAVAASNSTAATPLVQRAEIIEVFDKSREGYYDNDSMLHGSAMQQSQICDGCSEVPSAPMEYEKHIERNRGREEANAFVAIQNDDVNDDVNDDNRTLNT